MGINSKQKKAYTYLFSIRDKQEAYYFEEKSQKIYKIKTSKFNKGYGFSALFLVPLTLILKNEWSGNIWGTYFITCILGIAFGGIFSIVINKAFLKQQFEQKELTLDELSKSLANLKQVQQIKIALVIVWVLFFSLLSIMFFDKKDYTSLVSVNLICIFLYPLVVTLNFSKYKRIEIYLNQIVKSNGNHSK